MFQLAERELDFTSTHLTTFFSNFIFFHLNSYLVVGVWVSHSLEEFMQNSNEKIAQTLMEMHSGFVTMKQPPSQLHFTVKVCAYLCH